MIVRQPNNCYNLLNNHIYAIFSVEIIFAGLNMQIGRKQKTANHQWSEKQRLSIFLNRSNHETSVTENNDKIKLATT